MGTLAFFNMPGHWEWLIILAIMLLLFGKRLPEVMRGMGRGILEFKQGLKGIDDDAREATSLSEDEKARLETPADSDGNDVRVSRADVVE